MNKDAEAKPPKIIINDKNSYFIRWLNYLGKKEQAQIVELIFDSYAGSNVSVRESAAMIAQEVLNESS